MKVKDVYQRFGIQPNLQEHMFRVCAIVVFIEEHWTGKELVDWSGTKKAAVTHDLGNVVKFDLDKHPEFLGREQANINHWKRVQKQIIAKYGMDDHEATKRMLLELKVSNEITESILNKSFDNSIMVKNSNNWPLKILYYADFRTLPTGIGTLEERIADVRARMPKYTSRPDFEDLVAAGREIEGQLQRNLNIPVSEISDDSVKIDTESLLNLEV